MDSWMQSWRPRGNSFCDFCTPSVCSIAPATKKWCQVIRSAAPVAQKSSYSKPEDLMIQNAPPLKKSAPWPPNISDESDEHVSCTAPATRNTPFPDPVQKWPTPDATKPSRFAYFWQRAESLAAATQNDIWTSKRAPNPSVFYYALDFEICFAPQPCTCQHLNFQKWSDNGVFCTFWLRNVLRTTTACTFSTSQFLKGLRSWRALHILTSKCSSRQNGVHFFDISIPKSAPKLSCFVRFDFETCFALQRRALFHLSSGQMAPHPPLWRAYILTLRSHKSLEKLSESRLMYLFAHLHLISSNSFSSLIFSLLLFSSLTSLFFSSLLFSDSSHLCFSTCPYCQKFDF